MATMSKPDPKKNAREYSTRLLRARSRTINLGSVGEVRQFAKFWRGYKSAQATANARAQRKAAESILASKAARRLHGKVPIASLVQSETQGYDQEIESGLVDYVANAFTGILRPKTITGEDAELPKKSPLGEYYKRSSDDDICTIFSNYGYTEYKYWLDRESTPDLRWAQSPDLILEKLVDSKATSDEISTAILFAEVQAFDEIQTTGLLIALRKFIEENRFTQIDEVVTVLGAAIRKFALKMKPSDFGAFASWLMTSETLRVHPDIELELAKGALWRVKYTSLLGVEDFSQLIQGLRGLASDYLKPRLILDKNYASIARIAITATFAMEVWMKSMAESQNLRHLSLAMNLAWFLEAVDFEVCKLIETVEHRDSSFAERLKSCWLQVLQKDV